MPGRRPYLEVFLLSLAVLLLEVSYTRIFSYKLVYFFTYLIIGISLLGLGAGAVLVAMVPRLRRAGVGVIPACCLAGAAGVLVGYLVVAGTQVNAFLLVRAIGNGETALILAEGGKLLAVCIALFVPYLCAGIGIAVIFATGASAINRLYFADLVGAGLACALAVPLMTWIGPPGSVALGGAACAAAGIRLAAGRGMAAALVVLAVVLAGAAARPAVLPDPVTDRVKTMSPSREGGTVAFSRWSPVFRVDVLEDIPGAEGFLVLSHDGMWGSVLPRWDGDLRSLSRYDADVRAYPFALLGPGARVAIIGAAGGNEILASLYFDAAQVTAIELNPVTVSLLTDRFRRHIGDVAGHERVELVNAEGRSFLMSRQERWDAIWFVAPDSYAAMNAATSGAYVLSESYLYTVEMITESLEHLSERGVICTQFGEAKFDQKPNRTARYLATAREAYRRLGITDFERHVLVSSTPGFVFATSTILLKRTPFTDDEVARFVATTERLEGGVVRHAPGRPPAGNPVDRVVTTPAAALDGWYETYPYDVRPVTDDAPFFWHFVPFRSALQAQPHAGLYDTEDGMGERLLLVLLAVAVVLATLFLLAPLLVQRALWRTIPHKAEAAVYFAALGLGFMFLEVPLIQHLTLFLGYPTYSLTVTLFALLLSTGAGSVLSERLRLPRARLLVLLGVALVLLVLAHQLVLGPLLARGVGWPFPVRVAVAVAVLAPLGLVLGAFMPLGLSTVAGLTPHAEAYVAWAWAVNGFCSVIASVLSTLLSMALGFDTVMLVALALYGIGITALSRIPSPTAVAQARTPSRSPE